MPFISTAIKVPREAIVLFNNTIIIYAIIIIINNTHYYYIVSVVIQTFYSVNFPNNLFCEYVMTQ